MLFLPYPGMSFLSCWHMTREMAHKLLASARDRGNLAKRVLMASLRERVRKAAERLKKMPSALSAASQRCVPLRNRQPYMGAQVSRLSEQEKVDILARECRENPEQYERLVAVARAQAARGPAATSAPMRSAA